MNPKREAANIAQPPPVQARIMTAEILEPGPVVRTDDDVMDRRQSSKGLQR